MGLLSGACILARADLAFLVLAMCLDHLLVRRRRRAGHGWRGEVAVAGATCALVCLPWMIYGVVAVGSPFPESGRATRFLALAYAPFFDSVRSRWPWTDRPPVSWRRTSCALSRRSR
jgi:hypothetical protein